MLSAAHTATTRFALNFKGVAYETVWIEYGDIQSAAKEAGAPPTSLNDDGSPHYTVPFIKDHSTGAVVSESLKIAAYLDDTYPALPALFPAGTRALQHAFYDALEAAIVPVYFVAVPNSYAYLTPSSKAAFRAFMEPKFGGGRLEALSPAGSAARVAHMKAIKETLGKINGWLEANGPEEPYFIGSTVSFADLVVAAYVGWFKTVAPEEWDEVASWNGGRWAAFVESFEKYRTVV